MYLGHLGLIIQRRIKLMTLFLYNTWLVWNEG
ncbi:Protein of unknown function [Pyronema omphalodes CBS 100304]|uniref:Uncharacterized protein n=1 Tax=Pyronema omphalodes (strain CBS 100304) TaxID=1076935 RepID=U4KWU5_PYROM|nr:Protein of unknown function [Pyronema omphalodes CBS 100304]